MDKKQKYFVKPHKDMTWLDLADAIQEHCNIKLELKRGFVWNDSTATDGKYFWYAAFWKYGERGSRTDITASSGCTDIMESIEYAVKFLIGNFRVRSPYAVFKSLEKDHKWKINLDYEYTFKLCIDKKNT